MWLHWIRLSSNPMVDVLIDRERHVEKNTQRRGDWYDVSLSQGMTRTDMNIKSWKDKMYSPQEHLEKCIAGDFLIIDL